MKKLFATFAVAVASIAMNAQETPKNAQQVVEEQPACCATKGKETKSCCKVKKQKGKKAEKPACCSTDAKEVKSEKAK
ncbi:MAG: hypothetical protein Q4C75_07925 [Bergeyella zoohelcum]|nr:hypothetical protein [Bergeyella zoohelcum]